MFSGTGADKLNTRDAHIKVNDCTAHQKDGTALQKDDTAHQKRESYVSPQAALLELTKE